MGMDRKITLCTLDWNALCQNMDDVVGKTKSLDEIAYLAVFGLQKESGLPTWFAFNDYCTVPDDEPETIAACLQDKPNSKPVALMYDCDPQDAHCMIIRNCDIIDNCAFAIGDHIFNVNKDEMLNAFRRPFVTYARTVGDKLIMSGHKGSIVALGSQPG